MVQAKPDPYDHLYQTEERRTLAEAPGLRVRILRLAKGQQVPWHTHSEISDTFFCMEGPMEIQLKDPVEAILLQAGGTYSVGPQRPHLVHGGAGGACRFMIVQGVGEYDYLPLEQES